MKRTHKLIFAGVIGITTVVGAGGLWYYKKKQVSSCVKKASDYSEIHISKLNPMENLVPFLVLGSGPASLAAALYGARTRIKTIVLKGNQPGGQLTGTSYIENWPAIRKIKGVDVVRDFEDQAARFGAVMVNDAAKSVDLSQWPYEVITDEGRVLYALSLFIGTGSTAKRLSVPGEKELWGKGVTTCAICDAPFHAGHTVVVIGGGDSAVEEALELSSYAARVIMLVRGGKLKASPSVAELLNECSNIEIKYNYSLAEIYGENHVDGIMVKNNKTGKTEKWDEVKGVFLAIGHIPNSWMVKNQVALDKNGYIAIEGRRQMTSQPGVFAAGDVADHRYKQAGVAAGDGIKAGLDAMWWLSEIGYTSAYQKIIESYFYDPRLHQKVKVTELTTAEELDKVIQDNPQKIVVLDFFTESCPSCMYMMPVIEWVATKMQDEVYLAKVNASEAFDIVKRFRVPNVPHFIVLKGGKVIGRSSDVMERNDMYLFVKKYVN